MNLTVVIPALNEGTEIHHCCEAIRAEHHGELFVVDGGSQDDTVEKALEAGARVYHAPRGLRAQCNFGARHAKGDILLFLAADSRLESGWRQAIEDVMKDPKVCAGGFRLGLRDPHPFFRLIALGGNLRARLDRIALPDQGLFVRRQSFEQIKGMPESTIPFAALCFALRAHGSFRLLPQTTQSSTRRWHEQGWLRTTWAHIRSYRQFKRA